MTREREPSPSPVTPPGPVPTAECPRCGAGLAPGSRSCSLCGARLSERGTTSARFLGPYRLVRRLERWSRGETWEAEDDREGRVVALRLLPPSIGEGDALVRLRATAKAARNLAHDNILGVHRLEQIGLSVVLAIELPPGPSLSAAWDAPESPAGRRIRADVPTLAVGIVEALAYAHGKRIVHGDLRPECIYVNERGRVAVADFGLGVAVDELAPEAAAFPGADAWWSPQRRARDGASPADDLYAFGVLLIRALEGTDPGKSDAERDAVVEWLSAAARWCAAESPGTRPADARELLPYLIERRVAQRFRATAESRIDRTPAARAAAGSASPELPRPVPEQAVPQRRPGAPAASPPAAARPRAAPVPPVARPSRPRLGQPAALRAVRSIAAGLGVLAGIGVLVTAGRFGLDYAAARAAVAEARKLLRDGQVDAAQARGQAALAHRGRSGFGALVGEADALRQRAVALAGALAAFDAGRWSEVEAAVARTWRGAEPERDVIATTRLAVEAEEGLARGAWERAVSLADAGRKKASGWRRSGAAARLEAVRQRADALRRGQAAIESRGDAEAAAGALAGIQPVTPAEKTLFADVADVGKARALLRESAMALARGEYDLAMSGAHGASELAVTQRIAPLRDEASRILGTAEDMQRCASQIDDAQRRLYQADPDGAEAAIDGLVGCDLAVADVRGRVKSLREALAARDLARAELAGGRWEQAERKARAALDLTAVGAAPALRAQIEATAACARAASDAMAQLRSGDLASGRMLLANAPGCDGPRQTFEGAARLIEEVVNLVQQAEAEIGAARCAAGLATAGRARAYPGLAGLPQLRDRLQQLEVTARSCEAAEAALGRGDAAAAGTALSALDAKTEPGAGLAGRLRRLEDAIGRLARAEKDLLARSFSSANDGAAAALAVADFARNDSLARRAQHVRDLSFAFAAIETALGAGDVLGVRAARAKATEPAELVAYYRERAEELERGLALLEQATKRSAACDFGAAEDGARNARALKAVASVPALVERTERILTECQRLAVSQKRIEDAIRSVDWPAAARVLESHVKQGGCVPEARAREVYFEASYTAACRKPCDLQEARRWAGLAADGQGAPSRNPPNYAFWHGLLAPLPKCENEVQLQGVCETIWQFLGDGRK